MPKRLEYAIGERMGRLVLCHYSGFDTLSWTVGGIEGWEVCIWHHGITQPQYWRLEPGASRWNTVPAKDFPQELCALLILLKETP